jgi:hypothetical protein
VGKRAWSVLAVLAAAGVALIVSTSGDPDEVTDAGEEQPDARTAFLDAYERSRTSTFVVEQVFTRSVDGSPVLTYEQRLVQRPPDDRLVVGGGSAEGRVGGRVLRCATSPAGQPRCFEGEAAGPYAEKVDAEVGALRELVSGDDPVYAVTEDDAGCFVLDLQVVLPSPPYGELARFCFDAVTGAPTRFEVHRPRAVDVVEATAVRGTVEDADLRHDELGELPASEAAGG